jgi:exosortase
MSTAATPAIPQSAPVPTIGIFLFAAVALAHAPLIGLHLVQVWDKAYYQYMPLVPIGAVILAGRHFRDSFGQPDFGFKTQFLTALGLLFLAASVLWYSPWLSVISLVLNLGVAARLSGGVELARTIRPGALFLLLMLPLPFESDVELLQVLQRATVKGSGAVYEWAGGYCMIVGVIVRLPDLPEPLFVAEACSGIQSLFAVITCTVFYLIWSGRGFIHSMLVLVAGVGWVMAANTGRILAVMTFTKPGILDLSTGWKHEALGMLTFLSAFLLTLSTDRFFLVFNPPRETPRMDEEDSPRVVSRLGGLQWAGATVFSALLLAAGAYSAGNVFTSSQTSSSPFTFLFDLPELPPNHMPQTLGDWRLIRSDGIIRRTKEDVMASNSQQWRYSNGFQNAIVSLDWPYPATHDLQICYENIGWQLAARDLLDVPSAHAPPFGDFVRLRLQNRNDEYAYVAFSAFALTGAPETLGRLRLVDAFQERFQRVVKKALNRGDGKIRIRQPIYQVQVVSESPLPLTHAQVRQLDELFLHARRHFAPPKMTPPAQ